MCTLKLKSTLLWLLFMLSAATYAQSIDNTGYELAQKYSRENNRVLTYKYLIIFKYTNLARLNQPQNIDALRKLDSQIATLENLLSQNYDWYIIKRSRGYSDKQLDSAMAKKRRTFILEEIRLK